LTKICRQGGRKALIKHIKARLLQPGELNCKKRDVGYNQVCCNMTQKCHLSGYGLNQSNLCQLNTVA